MKYIKLRTRIVLVLAVLYIVAFLILDMPGMILITLLIVLLSYIPYLQYLALIPLAVGCLVLSVENEQSFLLLFGIVVGVFVSASLIEELVLTPWIMEKNIGMNPVIMVLALSVWGYLLGIPGTLIGIPMTSLLIIYIKRHIIPSYKEVLQD
jgi:predicted PurR-regulated permease PerM